MASGGWVAALGFCHDVRDGIKSWNDEEMGDGWIDWVATMTLGYREATQTFYHEMNL